MADKKQSRFDLVIGAVDRFAGVFKGFNDRVDRAKEKLDRLKNSTTNLGRATGLGVVRRCAALREYRVRGSSR